MKHTLIGIEPMKSCGGLRPLSQKEAKQGRRLGISGYSVKWSGRDNITGRECSCRHPRLKTVRVRSFLTHLSEGPDSSGSCVSVPLCLMKKLVTLTFTLFSDLRFLKETHSHSHQSTKEQHTNWTGTTQPLTDSHSLTPALPTQLPSPANIIWNWQLFLNIISPFLAKSLCTPPSTE